MAVPTLASAATIPNIEKAPDAPYKLHKLCWDSKKGWSGSTSSSNLSKTVNISGEESYVLPVVMNAKPNTYYVDYGEAKIGNNVYTLRASLITNSNSNLAGFFVKYPYAAKLRGHLQIHVDLIKKSGDDKIDLSKAAFMIIDIDPKEKVTLPEALAIGKNIYADSPAHDSSGITVSGNIAGSTKYNQDIAFIGSQLGKSFTYTTEDPTISGISFYNWYFPYKNVTFKTNDKAKGLIDADKEKVSKQYDYTGSTPVKCPVSVNPAKNYKFDYWTCDKNVENNDGTKFIAGSKISNAQLSKIRVTSDLVFTGHFSKNTGGLKIVKTN